jgi:DNA-binding NarL/FixJ family response regulator
MTKVAVADNNVFYRRAFVKAISEMSDVDLVGIATSQNELFELLKTQSVDVLFIEIYLPVAKGFELIRQISTLYPNVKIIALSSFEQSIIIKQAVEAGVSGYLSKCRDNFGLLSEIFSEHEKDFFYLSNGLNKNESNLSSIYN